MRSAYQLVLVPSHTARLATYREMVEAQQPKSASAKSEKSDIDKSLGKMATFERSCTGVVSVKSPTEYSTDPKTILDARREVAEMIEKMGM
jgi:hypothetical protein